MTQETAEQKQKQKYFRVDGPIRFDSYEEARREAVRLFEESTRQKAGTELTTPTHKVRVKRRVRNGREHFEVVMSMTEEIFKKTTSKTEVPPAAEEPKPERIMRQAKNKASGKKDRKALERKLREREVQESVEKKTA